MSPLQAQVDTSLNELSDTTIIAFPSDTNVTDTTKIAPKNKSGLEDKVEYTAKDSIIYDVGDQKAYLYGEATVTYGAISLNANYIEIDLDKTEVYAAGLPDSNGVMQGEPDFTQDGKTYQSSKMSYNFKSKKGKIYEARTQEGGGYLHGAEVKRVNEDVFFIKEGKYTTCNLEDPHFYFKSQRLKLAGGNIVTGPTNLVISEVPTIAWLPFGFFPAKDERKSGIIIPQIGQSAVRGFNLTNGGYFWALSDYVNLALTGDIYTNGSYSLRANSQYAKRYRFRGNFNLNYTNTKDGDPETPEFNKIESYAVIWSHQQDPKANPNSTFSANVNTGSSNRFTNDFQSSTNNYLNNQFKSSINYTRRFAGTPFNLAISASQSQNTRDSTVSVTLPEAAWTMNRIQPFKRKRQIGGARWYEKVGLSWTSNFKNEVKTKTDELFEPSTLDKMQYGVKHNVPLSTSMKFLKYSTVSPSVSWQETWYGSSISRSYVPTSEAIREDTIPGFQRFGKGSVSMSWSSKLYGMYSYRSERIKAVRHTLTPQISFTLSPNLNNERFFKSYIDSTGKEIEYNILARGIYGAPNLSESGSVNFQLQNNAEMKFLSRKDSTETEKKAMLFDAFNFSARYNIFADSLNWSSIRWNARSRVGRFMDFQMNATWNPYAMQEGKVINMTQFEKSGHLLRFEYFDAAVNFNLKSKNVDKPKKDELSEDELDYLNRNYDQFVDFNIPWTFRLQYKFTYRVATDDKQQSVRINGDVRLTENWKVGYNTILDVDKMELGYTQLSIHRNLHCWQMDLSIVPFGERKNYTFYIGVSAPMLQDLKLQRQRNNYDF